MKTRLLYFASVREKIGANEESVELPAALTTVADLVAWQRQRGEAFADAFAEGNRIRIAVDQEHAGNDASIAGASEIAFFPPVTGG
jgi:molybdopterin synthase sulfur carrier subunit